MVHFGVARFGHWKRRSVTAVWEDHKLFECALAGCCSWRGGRVMRLGNHNCDAPLARAAGRARCSAACAPASATAVARALVSAWSSTVAGEEEARKRLTTPFLKAADALLSGIGDNGNDDGEKEEEALCAPCDPSDPSSPSLAQAMLDLALAACRRCRDPARLCAASALLCHLAGVDGRRRRRGKGEEEERERIVVEHRATAARALRAAASLTGHSYPTVRRAAAENLSLRLLMGAPVVEDEGGVEEEEGRGGQQQESVNTRARAAVWRESNGGGGSKAGGEGEEEEEEEEIGKGSSRPDAAAASDLLSETAWDAATPLARAARARLFELLCLPAPGGGHAAAAEEEASAERAAAEAQRRRMTMTREGGVSSAATTTAASSSGYQSLIDAVSRGGAD